MNAMDEGGGEGSSAPRARSRASMPLMPLGWGRLVEHYPLHLRFKDAEDEDLFAPYFGALKMENDIFWACMSAVMITRMFIMLYNDGSITAGVAAANSISFWATSGLVVYLILRRTSLYLQLRTKLLMVMRLHRAVVLIVFISLPAVQVIKWSRLLSEEPPWRYLVPIAFDCITLVAICGWQLLGVGQAVAGGVLMLVPALRILRRCQPLAAAAADASRQAMVSKLAAAADRATSALMPLTLTAGAVADPPAPCTQSNLALVLTFGFMLPMLMCYAMEERCRLDFAAKRGVQVTAPSRWTALAHAAALLAFSAVIFWTGLGAIAPWAANCFVLY